MGVGHASERLQLGMAPGVQTSRADRAPLPEIGPDRGIALPVLARVVALLDTALLLAVACGAASFWPVGLPSGQWVVCVGLYLYAATVAFRAQHAYRAEHLSRLRTAWRIVLVGIGVGIAALWGVAWLLHDGASGMVGWIAWTGVAGLMVLGVARAVLCLLLALWRATGRLSRNVAVIGANDYSRSFIEAIRADPASLMSIVGLYDDRLNRLPPGGSTLPVQGNIATLIADARQRRIDVIVVALPLSASERIAQIRGQLSPTVADIFLTADTAGLRYDGRDFAALGRNGVIRVARRPLDDADAAMKSTFDRVLAALLLLLLGPLLLGLAVAIRLDSPGPALFRQPRTGFNNRAFMVLKFRTMYCHLADLHADRQTTRDDLRVTKLGRFLRRSSLDELPQLVNVLRGEMSLVGPRPHAAHTKAGHRFFDEVVAEYALRHRIKPGITGWAQVNGWRGETAHVAQIEQRVAHDLAYIENWSLLLDIRILFMTALRGFRDARAY